MTLRSVVIVVIVVIVVYFLIVNVKLLEWIHDHMTPNSLKKTDLRTLIDNGNYKIKYLHYNWDLNSNETHVGIM